MDTPTTVQGVKYEMPIRTVHATLLVLGRLAQRTIPAHATVGVFPTAMRLDQILYLCFCNLNPSANVVSIIWLNDDMNVLDTHQAFC